MRRRPIPVIAVMLGLALLAACGHANERPVEAGASPTSSQPEATTTSKLAQPAYPLTGAPIADLASSQHPAVVVKIDNSADARPQSGINQADVVYELLVEGITRYAVVFHSQVPDRVGPVRSARSSDIELVGNLGAPLIAWSGGNPGVTDEVQAAVSNGLLVDAGQNVAGGQYHRDGSRRAPHNLYVNATGALSAATPAGAGAPPSLFRFREPFEPYVGGSLPAPGYAIDFGGGARAEYVWDAERAGWDRFQADGPTIDSDGVQVAPQNVVVLFVPYGQSPSDARSPMALTTGEGDAVVLTDGKAITGRWSRPDVLSGWELVDQSGNPIRLSPGRTWVALPEVGSAVTPLDPGAAGALLAGRA